MDDLLERFEARYIPEPNSGCWLWIGALQNGYGSIKKEGRNYPAHRLSYEMNKGAIPGGLVIDHLCRVPSCVNPDHLEPVTIGENISRGDNHHRRKTHCPKGHEYTPENTKIYGPSRFCRACNLERSREWRIKNAIAS